MIVGIETGLDEIVKWGDPWHGLYRFARTELPNGSTRIPATPPSEGDCCEIRVPGTPAVTTSEADAAAGMTWLNYGLLAGKNHVLFGVALGAMSWVAIAEDNTAMVATVALANVNTTEVTIKPLQGGLALQTISAIALTPAVTVFPEDLVVHKIMDISPDGRQVIIAHEYLTSNGYPHAISRLNISGVPGAMAATRTLIWDFNGAPAINGVEETDTRVTMMTWRELINNSDNTDPIERVFGPMTQAAWEGGGYTSPPAGYHQEWLQLEDLSRSGNAVRKDVVGYVFDDGVLRPVKFVNKRSDTDVGWLEPHGGTRVYKGDYTTSQYLQVGNFSGAEIVQGFHYDGSLNVATQTSGGVAAFYSRCSNRLYGMTELIGATTRYYPPVSPTGQASGTPFDGPGIRASYHPVTHEIAWHQVGLGVTCFV